ncbi:hypothetical protein SH668x_000039 [Planctomicrobium sp. SH668]|uniref:hypothetical protein n=1 Tax=Planctomicrobium sp. SH668 TaxID=3448126 RepID=UPI003F5BA389
MVCSLFPVLAQANAEAASSGDGSFFGFLIIAGSLYVLYQLFKPRPKRYRVDQITVVRRVR